MKSLPQLIGVIHLPPLAGAPGAEGLDPSAALAQAGLLAVKEAQLLQQAGFEAIFLENFGDTPFYKEKVPPETIVSLSVIAAAVREAVKIPIGINVLRNDAHAALAIAAVTGCEFIRVNVLAGVAATDQGLIEGCAASLIRERIRLGTQTRILADAHVKHARSLSSDQLSLAIEEVALRSRADGVIITGETTGRAVSTDALKEAGQTGKHHGIPIYIGSGATIETLPEIFSHLGKSAGVIVGSALRRGGKAGAPLDPKRVKALVQAFRLAKKGKSSKLKKK